MLADQGPGREGQPELPERRPTPICRVAARPTTSRRSRSTRSTRRHLVASDNNYIRGDGTCGAALLARRRAHVGGHDDAERLHPRTDRALPASTGRPAATRRWPGTRAATRTRAASCSTAAPPPRRTPTSRARSWSSAPPRTTGRRGTSPAATRRSFFDPTGTARSVLEDKAADGDRRQRRSSPFRDRIYVTWTEFAADGTAYIYEVHSSDYGETFSAPVLVSAGQPALHRTRSGAGTPNGQVQREPVLRSVRRPRRRPVRRLRQLQQLGQPAATTTTTRCCWRSRPTAAHTFSAPVKVSDYYDLPDCDTYQGDGADPGRACVPEKGSSTKSVFRATNYPSGQVNPKNPNLVTVTFGSYINPDSNESQRVRAGRLQPRRRHSTSTPGSRRRERATTRSC